MKTILATSILALLSAAAPAQDEVWTDTDAATVSYDAPVVYQAPVIYQASVVYNAPVFYFMGPVAQPDYCEPAFYEPHSPNVIVVGGPAYYTSWDTTPNVIIIGHNPGPRVSPVRRW